MIEQIVAKAVALKASDIHIVCGIPVRFRVDGVLQNMDDHVLTKEDCKALAEEIAKDHFYKINNQGEADLAITAAGRRCRVNVFLQQGSYSVVLRILNNDIPSLDTLGLPAVVSKFPEYKNGLVLVTGETGSGKSTTLAAVLNSINKKEYKHILTLEDPIEYVYTPDKCVINQREVGRDTQSFANGLRAALREDPDVILVGEMRDLDTIEIALTAAETGHLVFGTVHTNSAADAVDRIVDVFPAERQRQIRLQLSMSLKAVVSQQLLRRRTGGRVAVCEVMVVDYAIRNLIREGKTPPIVNAIQTSQANGCIPMNTAVMELLSSGVITTEVAMNAMNEGDRPNVFSGNTGVIRNRI
jgi:twitching motility protein PilT